MEEATIVNETHTTETVETNSGVKTKWYQSPYFVAGRVILETVAIIGVSAFAFRMGQRTGAAKAQMDFHNAAIAADMAIADAMAAPSAQTPAPARTAARA